jgi:hypothetical protein
MAGSGTQTPRSRGKEAMSAEFCSNKGGRLSVPAFRRDDGGFNRKTWGTAAVSLALAPYPRHLAVPPLV